MEMDGLPPGPRIPGAIQLVATWKRPGASLERMRRRYGKRITVQLPFQPPFVILSDPNEIRELFMASPTAIHPGEGARVLEPTVGSNSVILLDEAAHMEQRKLLLPSFHGQRMQRYRELMAEIAAEEIERWPRGEPYRLRPRMQAMTLEIILRAVFGLEQGERLERLRVELRKLLDMLTRPEMLVTLMLLGPERLSRFGPFRSMQSQVDKLILDEVAERRNATDLDRREDILSMLLAARHEDGSPMSDRELRDELLTLLVAGHETTATALAWAVERLIRHPDKLDRLSAEVRAGETEYLDAVVTETLRLRPVISLVARRLTEPVTIGGWELPAGITVTPSIYLVHRRPDVYPNPERFEPERFLGTKPGTYTWIPFGGGTRRCLGAALAMAEQRIVLRAIARRVDLEAPDPRPERGQHRNVTLIPHVGGLVRVRSRT